MSEPVRRAMNAAIVVGAIWPLTPKVGRAQGVANPATADMSSGSERTLPDRSPDQWMQEWKRLGEGNKDLEGPLDVRRFKDPTYVLLKAIGWKPGPANPGHLKRVVVPRGFVTDFASVPRVFWSLFRPDGNYAYAAVLHDFLYWQQDRPKSDADAIFRAAMEDLKISDWQSTVLFQAVNNFGSSAWSSNQVRKKGGEKRILKKLPSNSDVTWAEWKGRPGVF